MAASCRPSVSVVIPVFHARFLHDALDSVLNQTEPPEDIIVVDDGSPDRHVLSAIVARGYRRVRVLRQPNAGAGAARNLAVRASHADLVAFLDADDLWERQHLERQLEALRRHAECDVVYANALYIGNTPLAGRRFMDVCPSAEPVTTLALLSLRCHIPLSTVVARRHTLVGAGLFDEQLRRGQDFDLWLRLAQRGVRFHHHAEVLARHRVHEDNLSGSSAMRMQRAAGVFRKALAELPLAAAERAAAEAQLRRFEGILVLERGKELLIRGDFAAARDALARAQRVIGSWKVGAALLGLHLAPHLVQRLLRARLTSTAL